MEDHYCKDFCDDDELGAGRILLQLLIDNKIECKAIFVARKYGGTKMGASRFHCYQKAAIAAIQKRPFNQLLKVEQHINPEKTNPKKRSLPSPNNPQTLKKTGQISTKQQAWRGNIDYRGRGSYSSAMMRAGRPYRGTRPHSTKYTSYDDLAHGRFYGQDMGNGYFSHPHTQETLD